MRKARVRRVTRVSLSHSQRGLVAQVVGINSVSTFCRNEMKDRNYSIFSFPFIFQEKMVQLPICLMSFFVANFPQPPLNHSREKEWASPENHHSAPLGKLWMLPNISSSQNVALNLGLRHQSILCKKSKNKTIILLLAKYHLPPSIKQGVKL